MQKIMIFLDTLLEILVFVIFSALILTVALQIVSRFAPIGPYIWTEELSRFLFIYIIVIACGLAVKSKEIINVDLIFMAMNKKISMIFKIFLNLISILFTSIMAFYAIEFAEIGLFQTSSALGLNMSYMYYSVFIMPTLLSIYLITDTCQILNNLKVYYDNSSSR